jgi:hypothetical protein
VEKYERCGCERPIPGTDQASVSRRTDRNHDQDNDYEQSCTEKWYEGDGVSRTRLQFIVQFWTPTAHNTWWGLTVSVQSMPMFSQCRCNTTSWPHKDEAASPPTIAIITGV